MSTSVIIIRVDYDDDRDGHRKDGILRTPNAADSTRRIYQGYNMLVHVRSG